MSYGVRAEARGLPATLASGLAAVLSHLTNPQRRFSYDHPHPSPWKPISQWQSRVKETNEESGR